MIKRIVKNLIIIIQCILYINILYAQTIGPEEIWMGWATNEYGGMSYGAVANFEVEDTKLQVKGYGRYQFKSNTNLVEFLDYADSEYFKKWIEMGKGSDRLNLYEYGLPQAWTDYYANNKEKFSKLQDDYLYVKYFYPIAAYFLEEGINIHDFSPYIKGAILSIVIYRYNKNEINQNISKQAVIDLIDCYDESEEKYINSLYDTILSKYSSQEEIIKRFTKEKRACIEQHDDFFDSKVGEMLNKVGDTNSLTMIRDLNNLNSTIFQNFLDNNKFASSENLEWYDAMRNSGLNFKDELGISSGVLDFSTSTSRGLNLANYLGLIEKEVVFNEVDNGTGIIYIPQNTSKGDYSNISFGSNNVAQGGASLACLSMAINKLCSLNITPANIIDKIKGEYGNYNHFYDEKNKGQKNEIIKEVCRMYGLSSYTISQQSVMGVLGAGHMVIARVQKSEFTKNGTFILLCGAEMYNGKTYVIIADPNIYHARYMYNLYELEYIANTCKGIFFDIG